ncbi:hypothetical protein HY375_00985, partial [Candidatus Berkelbacteria bacterium]|nr:hypothetical protein [Candidatus Berkelbacteria bacterium]
TIPPYQVRPMTTRGTDGLLNPIYNIENYTDARVARQVLVKDAGLLYATFDLEGTCLGSYNLTVEHAGKNASKASAFTVTDGPKGEVKATLSTASPLRVGWDGEATITYENIGETDVVAPLLGILPTNATFSIPGDRLFYRNGVSFLATNQESSRGPAGVLPVGGSGSFRFEYRKDDEAGLSSVALDLVNFSGGDIELKRGQMADSILEQVGKLPAEGNTDDNLARAEQYAPSLMALSNTPELANLLAENATYLGLADQYPSDLNSLLVFELHEQNAYGMAATAMVGVMGIGGPGLAPERLKVLGENRLLLFIPDLTAGDVFYEVSDGVFKETQEDGRMIQKEANGYRLSESDGTIVQFDGNGRASSMAGQLGAGLRYEWNGNLLSSIVTDTGTTRFEYVRQGAQTYISKEIDELGRVTTYAVHESLGGKKFRDTVSYPDGKRSIITYVEGRLVNQVIEEVLVTGEKIEYAYDERSRTTEVRRPVATATYAYQPGLRVIKRIGSRAETYVYDHGGALVRMVDANGNEARYKRDEQGQTRLVIGPHGATGLAYAPDGAVTSVTDVQGVVTRFDRAGPNGRLTGVTDGLGHRTAVQYNTSGDVSAVADPLGAVSRFEYNGSGQPQTVIQPGTTGRVEYAYRPESQLLERIQYDSGLEVRYGYDEFDRITSLANGNEIVRYEFDERTDLPKKVTNPAGRALTYQFDDLRRLVKVTSDDGHFIEYHYTDKGQLASITSSGLGELVRFTYDDQGQLISEQRKDSVTTTYQYTSLGFVERVTRVGAGDKVLDEERYTYDTSGRLVAIHSLNQGTTTLRRDALGQLTGGSFSSGKTIEYEYDAVGNRVSQVIDGQRTMYSTNAANQYTRFGDWTLSYDELGRLNKKTNGSEEWRYEWSGAGQLIAIHGPNFEATYKYDPSGRLAARTENGQSTEYLIDPLGLGTVFAEYQEGRLARRYAYGQDRLYASLEDSGGVEQLHGNQVGSITFSTSPTNPEGTSYGYEPFGTVADPSAPRRFGFVGQFGVQTDGSGLLYMRNRWYDPALGRFISPDPTGFAAGDTNLYRYVKNQPDRLVDPTGLEIPGTPTAASAQQMVEHWLKYIERNRARGNLEAVKWGQQQLAKAYQVLLQILERERIAQAAWEAAKLRAAIEAELKAQAAWEAALAKAEAEAAWKAALAKAEGQIAAEGAATVAEASAVSTAVGAGARTFGQRLLGGSPITLALTAATEFPNIAPYGPYWRARYDAGYNSNAPAEFGDRGLDHLMDNWVWADEDVDGDGDSDAADIRKKITDKARQVQADADWCRDRGKYYLWLGGEEARIQWLAHNCPEYLRSKDPNDILGPTGYGEEQWVANNTVFPYAIRFENDPKQATADAQQVVVTETLDGNLDLATFEWGSYGFGSHRFSVEGEAKTEDSFSRRIDLVAEQNLYVDAEGTLDRGSRQVKWTLTAIDPSTGQPAYDARRLEGFLPVNNDSHDGEGFVSYSVRPKSDLATGTTIAAKASIVFDQNAAIDTPEHSNKIDASTPTGSLGSLAAETTSAGIALTWSGTDEGAGVASYDVFASDNGSPFARWLTASADTTATYPAETGHVYSFAVAATDGANLAEGAPVDAEGTTTVTIAAATTSTGATTGTTPPASQAEIVRVKPAVVAKENAGGSTIAPPALAELTLKPDESKGASSAASVESGETFTITFSEPVNPETLVADLGGVEAAVTGIPAEAAEVTKVTVTVPEKAPAGKQTLTLASPKWNADLTYPVAVKGVSRSTIWVLVAIGLFLLAGAGFLVLRRRKPPRAPLPPEEPIAPAPAEITRPPLSASGFGGAQPASQPETQVPSGPAPVPDSRPNQQIASSPPSAPGSGGAQPVSTPATQRPVESAPATPQSGQAFGPPETRGLMDSPSQPSTREATLPPGSQPIDAEPYSRSDDASAHHESWKGLTDPSSS